jgi:hypothetical protein
MPEDDDTEDQSHHSENPTVPANPNPIGESDGETPQNQTNNTADHHPHWADRTIAVFTVLIFLTYITSDYFLWRQLQITARQLDQMKGSSTQTDRLLEKADSIAKSMDVANAQQKAALDETLDQNRDALARTLAQAKTALDASIAASRTDQRAWVGIVNLKLPKEPIAGQDITITYTLTNTGKTPALGISAKMGFFFRNAEPPSPDWSQVVIAGKGGAAFPNSVSDETRATFYAKSATGPLIEAYKSGTTAIYLWLHVDYEDIFGISHWVQICTVHTSQDAPDRFTHCAQADSVDRSIERR